LPSFVQPHFHPVEDKSGEVNPTEVSLVPVNTPPSPSLLASTADDEMLSRRRLRLISKMFVQMCEAVEACHQAGVCHRDIKPENFIVVDDRKGTLGDNWKAQSTDHQLGVRTSVTVKITDWGLGTSSKACEDFDCGSKPYMAYGQYMHRHSFFP
jgi:serine/threonine protein kinase